MKSKKKEFIVGIFVLFGLMLMTIMVVQFGRMGDGLDDSYEIFVGYEDATGIIKGSEVRMGGAVIGKTLTRPELNERSDGVVVELSIRGDVKIPENSSFQIASLNFLGDRFIEIRPPLVRTGNFLQAGALVQGKQEGGLAAIQQQAEDLSEQAVRTMKKIDDSLASIDGVVEEIRDATKHIANVSQKVDEEILSAENLEHFESSLAELDGALKGIQLASKRLPRMMDNADLAIVEMREGFGEARTTISKANGRLDELGPVLLDMPATLKEFRSALGKAGRAMDGLSNGKGLLGALSSDLQMQRDAKEFLSNLRQYGILRYRDPEGDEQVLPDYPETRRR